MLSIYFFSYFISPLFVAIFNFMVLELERFDRLDKQLIFFDACSRMKVIEKVSRTRLCHYCLLQVNMLVYEIGKVETIPQDDTFSLVSSAR